MSSIANAQSPNIYYSSSSATLSVGSPFTAIINNTGGAVPATVYGQVTTLAGNTNSAGYSGHIDATGTSARFWDMEGVVGDANGNIYVAEYKNRDIRKITPAGVVTTIAGTATVKGNQDGIGTAALFGGPDGLALDAAGTTLYIADYDNNSIRKMNLSTGAVTTWVTLVAGASCMSFDNSGNLYCAEQDANQIQVISPTGVVTTIAGNNTPQYINGTGSAARFYMPNDVQVDASNGDVYVADYLNNAIRKVTSAGVVTTFAGTTDYQYTLPESVTYADGVGTAARFNNPTGVAILGNVVYVADLLNYCVRSILPNQTVTTIAGSSANTGWADGIGTAAKFGQPVDIWIDNSGVGYVIDGTMNNIRKVVLTGYTISPSLPTGLTFDQTTGTISGTPTAGFLPNTYTISGFNTSGYSSTTITLSCLNNWNGSTSADWNTTSNWSAGHVPVSGETIQIGVSAYSGSANQPTISNSASVTSIQFGANNSPVLTINSGKTLTVSSGITGNTACSATIAGPGNLTLGGSSVINANGSITASSNLVITLSASSTLTNNGTFTLASDANGSA